MFSHSCSGNRFNDGAAVQLYALATILNQNYKQFLAGLDILVPSTFDSLFFYSTSAVIRLVLWCRCTNNTYAQLLEHVRCHFVCGIDFFYTGLPIESHWIMLFICHWNVDSLTWIVKHSAVWRQIQTETMFVVLYNFHHKFYANTAKRTWIARYLSGSLS